MSITLNFIHSRDLKILKAVCMFIMIFCNVMPCTVVGGYQSFKETFCLHLEGRIPSALKMETNYTASHPRRL